jgi:uncharacterized protein (DUF433 family)
MNESMTDLWDTYIESDPEVKRGTPVIRGTRLTVSAVRTRIVGGDTINELHEDYPYIERQAFTVANHYAWSHSPPE